jgi:hypothetical protein
MRPPRFRFPNEVRETTRTIATRMVGDGAIAHTPQELEAWIAGAPDVREPLEHGGYGREFTADDLFPLLQVFVVQAGGPAPAPDTPPRASGRAWRVGLIVAVLVVLLIALVMAMR